MDVPGHVFVHRNGGTDRAKPNRCAAVGRAPRADRMPRDKTGARRAGHTTDARTDHRIVVAAQRGTGARACAEQCGECTHAARRPRTFSPVCALLSAVIPFFFLFPAAYFLGIPSARWRIRSTMHRRPHRNIIRPYGLRRFVDTLSLRSKLRVKRRRISATAACLMAVFINGQKAIDYSGGDECYY